jgi:glycosyltransferase involved in cell wall biosynthesis
MKMLPEVKQPNIKHWDPNALLALARLQANQRAKESDMENAARIFAFVHAFFGLRALKKNDRLIWLETLGDLNQFDQQIALARRFNLASRFPLQNRLLELNAVRADTGSTSLEWMSLLNAMYGRYGYSAVEMESAKKKPLDRLVTHTSSISEGPLVSVIVPTFQGGPLLFTALSSLLNQSWQNLEIIVVDDGSGSEYEPYLQQAELLSAKIRVLRQQQNLGPYCARNAGLSIAKGEYITVHDDDDWSHGDKIATQVRHLLNNPEVPGNMTAHVRVTADLKFVRINNNPILTQGNFSSLMVHRRTFETIGMWDAVNRGGDSEFRDRLVSYFDRPVEVINEVPLSFTRTWEGSLTSGEMSRGFVDPSRLLYLNAYSQAHKMAKENQEFLHFPNDRKFPVPTSMKPGPRDKFLGSFDIVFMTDFRFPGGTTSLTLKEIETAADSGLQVGFIHADSPLNGPQNPVSSQLLALQLKGAVTQLSLNDHAHVEVLVVRHPSVVTYLDNVSTRLRVAQSVLIVNNPPVLVGGTGMVFDLPNSIANMDKLFEHRTLVVAESGVTRALCASLVPETRLISMTWPGLITPRGPYQPNFDGPPVLGRHSRDHDLKWPSKKADFEKAYKSSVFQTKILGGAESLKKKHGTDTVENVTVYGFGEVDVHEFLADVDFWVYFHDDKLVESFGMSIAEAMASGKVVILPPYLETSFGDGAVYAEPGDVVSIVEEYWNDPAMFLAQSERARDYVRNHFSAQAFLSRISKLKTASDV